MATYATITYYAGTYLGKTIESDDFARLALRASKWVDRLTFQRAAAIVTAGTATTNIDMIRMATCAIAEEMQIGGDAIQSESIGQNSVTYAATSSKMLTAEERYMQAAALYLGSTGLMFPGFNTGEYSGDADADE